MGNYWLGPERVLFRKNSGPVDLPHMKPLIEDLLDVAFHELQHDTGPQDPEYVHQRSVLREKFQKVISKSRRKGASEKTRGLKKPISPT